jgi:cytochrome c peroxidase
MHTVAHRGRLIRLSGLAIAAAGAVLLNFGVLIGTSAAQQQPEHVVAPSALLRPSRPLSWLQAPLPPNLEALVQDRAAATQLGKAFFWDMQVGSDGTQACASCHFAAGVDGRITNTISPGQPQVASSFQVGEPEGTLSPADFPFHQLTDPDDRASAVLRDRHDVVGSQGVVAHSFVSNGGDDGVDQCAGVADPIFTVHGASVRQVTPRQAPSVINAIFYTRNFWDGRADTYFNGVNPQGVSDQSAKVWKLVDGQPQLVQTIFPSAGLASQATGPGLSEVEMSCLGRTWQDVGRKLLKLRPLARQTVDPSDSVLGPIASSQSDSTSTGLSVNYSDLIQKAFRPEFWSGSDSVPVAGQSYSQIEANFPLFWGMSVELYEATLISDQTPYDRFLEGNDDALTPEQYQGLTLFNGKAGCMNCHFGAQLSNNVGAQTGQHFGFTGFEVTGVRPVQEDHGVGPIAKDALLDGAFKTPQLRNVELTGPYFHNGGTATLRQVVDFYNRGGDFDSPNLDSVMKRQATLSKEQRLSEDQKHALVSFLLALTDERVRYDRAPFDHPSLCVPLSQVVSDDGHTFDSMQCLPPVGADGAAQPHTALLGLDPYQP